jgi:hypothetical protein
MTLREAIRAVEAESRAEHAVFAMDEQLDQRATAFVQRVYSEIIESRCIHNILRMAGLKGIIETATVLGCMSAFLLGMRVQRKLDHPERLTTIGDVPGDAFSAPPSNLLV